MAKFFAGCFHADTYEEVRFLRANLDWRNDRTDRFIAALCLGALHGESHRSPNYFSNRMPRTISTKPAYSVRWWVKHGYAAPRRDVFAILRNMVDFRFRTPPPESRGEVVESDARKANLAFPHLEDKVTDIITPPLPRHHQLPRRPVAPALVLGRAAQKHPSPGRRAPLQQNTLLEFFEGSVGRGRSSIGATGESRSADRRTKAV